MINLRIRELNPHIVCSLCAGYFIDAITINECLHTFCKSCLFTFLQTSKSCPQCGVRIHETQPQLHLKADHALQDIVFKLLPYLREDEETRINEFYKSKGIAREFLRDDDQKIPKIQCHLNAIDPDAHLYSKDEQMEFTLQPYQPDANPTLPTSKIRTSLRTCVYHIKKLLDSQLGPNNFQIIIGKNILLADDCSLHLAKILSDNLVESTDEKCKLILQYRMMEDAES